MTTGKLTSIEESLNYFLSTLVLSPTRRIAFPGDTFEPIANEIYLRPSFIPNRTDFGGVGVGAPRRHAGLYQVDVVGPVNVGVVTQSEIGDLIIEFFIQKVIIRNGIRVRIGAFDGNTSLPYRSPALVGGSNQAFGTSNRSVKELGWFVVPVTIPWWCDTF